MKNDRLFCRLLEIRTEIEFFQKLVNLGILDSCNSYIQSLMTLSTKIDVLLFKNDIDIEDFYKIFDLYDRFNLVVYNLYNSLRKEK